MFRRNQWSKWCAHNPVLLNISEECVHTFYTTLGDKKQRQFFINYIKGVKSHENLLVNFKKLLEYKKTVSKSGGVTYDAQYIALRDNITLDEAEEIVKANKFKTAGTLEAYIARAGGCIETGTINYNAFVQKAVAVLPTIKTHGHEFFKETSPRCIEYYTLKGYSISEAEKMVSAFQRKNSGVSRLYWLGKGYSKSETDEILSAINKRKASGIDYYKTKYGKNWEVEWDARIAKLRKMLGSLPLSDERDSYYCNVYKATRQTTTKHSNLIENYQLRGRDMGYDLDHIFSIKMGFIMNIPAEIIGHVTNLRIVEGSYNRSKQGRCDKTFEQLIEDYEKHESNK